MVDTLIANVDPVESETSVTSSTRITSQLTIPRSLRAIIRMTLATCPPATTAAFTDAARTRLTKLNATAVPDPATLFAPVSDVAWTPATALDAVLRRIRSLYGAGSGLASLRLLTAVVVGASRTRWEEDSEMEARLAEIDADIAQAVVSTGQEMDAGRIEDQAEAVDTRKALLDALKACQAAVDAWGGEFPFERALPEVEKWDTAQTYAR